MTSKYPILTLSNGASMPGLGFGVYRSRPEDTLNAVSVALNTGYRLIDTAAAYGNEAEVGEAMRQSDVSRSEVFVTTKLWISDYGSESALHGFQKSLRKLGLESLDLFLLHQPMPNEWDRTVEAWKAACRLLEDGRVRSIGVSNFSADQLSDLVERTGVVPHLNQVEVHPYFTQADLRATHARLGVVTQAWSPIGGVMRYTKDNPESAESPLSHPVVTALAERHNRSPAQIVLRWHLQNGVCAIPKSVHEARIRENFDVFGFSLTSAEMSSIGALDTGNRSGPNPANIDTLSYPYRIED